ncbi:MAG TPA: aromatic ring hydroxylase [Thermotoga naphthophila]|nr:aromatic ring hydroxylase [Thermotoga neapolitana]HBU00511.1 aromatic ring hydroxylase [Thermotoga petrophila]
MCMPKKVTKEDVLNALKNVIDFELGLDVVSLGLVYDIQIDDQNNVKVLMTMTTPMCPLAGMILSDAEEAIKKIEGVGNVEVELTFDPPWTPERMSPELREKFGI